MKQNLFRGAIVLLLIAAVASFFIFDLKQYTTLEFIKSQQEAMNDYYIHNTLTVVIVFLTIYIAVTALSLPLATPLTLLGGAIFGFAKGLLLISFASTIGATLAFLMARFLMKDWIQKKYGENLSKFNEGVEKEGAFYLFALRLVPVFPFFLINVVMGLTTIKTWTFYWASQIGMLAGTAVFVYAGTQLATLESLKDVASPKVLLAFALLGVFPIIAKKSLNLMRAKTPHE